jgi:hypothetical protein
MLNRPYDTLTVETRTLTAMMEVIQAVSYMHKTESKDRSILFVPANSLVSQRQTPEPEA